ncbi:MAG: hypothetical protein HOO06_11675 [Bdellovibrionaceae bacterium]|nr:hypothetical protein [Pseudobdellovibrionaceae bacterium]
MSAYLRWPSLHDETIIFVTDDNLWKVSLQGGQAQRLTTSEGICTSPFISPDGQAVAFINSETGQNDIYLMPIEGGFQQRLTYCGGRLGISGWKNATTLIVHSDKNSTSIGRVTTLFEINVETFKMTPISYGKGQVFETQNGVSLLGREMGDPARWKGYRGGTVGKIFIKNKKEDFKEILKKLKSNFCNPKLHNDRVYFISDHEDRAQIYSSDIHGRRVKAHSFQQDYYVRNFQSFGDHFVYQCGGDIFKLNIKTNESKKIEIKVGSHFKQSVCRFEDGERYMQHYNLAHKGDRILLTTRGQIYVTTPWSQKSKRLGDLQTRYKKATWATDREIVSIALNENMEEQIVVIDSLTNEQQIIAPNTDWGKIKQIVPHPVKPFVAVCNERSELWLLDVKKRKRTLIERNAHFFISDLTWNPDGAYLAYTTSESVNRIGIKVYDFKTKTSRFLLKPFLADSRPTFDPTGKYLFFVGQREFLPEFNEHPYEPMISRPEKIYMVNLTKERDKLLQQHLHFEPEDEDAEKKEKEKKKHKLSHVKIDFDGIEHRVRALDIPQGSYAYLRAVEDKLFYTRISNDYYDPWPSNWGEGNGETDLYCYNFNSNNVDVYEGSSYGFNLSEDLQWILIDTENGLRLVPTDSKPHEGMKADKKDGWVNLNHLQIYVDPRWEWQQMYQEAWVLQKEHFWDTKMNGVDWESVYFDYLPLLEKINTRSEFSDLAWEMQGELRTSHAYEYGGDYYRFTNGNKVGKLGAKLKFIAEKNMYEILEIYSGESWISELDSPLNKTGVQLKPGDLILGLDGHIFTGEVSIEELLENKVNTNVCLEIFRRKEKSLEEVVVQPISTDLKVLYRQWVEKNKAYVHEKSKGKLGYIHIPDMYVQGYSEFNRNFYSELDYEGMVVDVRYNGGGSISQFILRILAQRQIGWDESRWFSKFSYPTSAVRGPMVCLTNEMAGSDGDMFSHGFKLMKLGKLIGKRTWGGVVGIWPRNMLIEGTTTSQPEFAAFYKDVGPGLENYGTEPDIEIDIMPEDCAKGRDPQLDKGIEVALAEFKTNPPLKMEHKG